MCKIILPSMNLKVERWKWNKEYRVYVSTLGNFKDEYKRNIPIKIRSKSGYCAVMTACGYKVVHRLVLLTFKPIPNAEELTVDHLNHNKRDNSLENLEWVTGIENKNRAYRDLLQEEEENKKEKIVITKNTLISGGDALFLDINAAARFVKITQGSGDEVTIKNKIAKAIKYKKKFCGIKWNIKEIEGGNNYVK